MSTICTLTYYNNTGGKFTCVMQHKNIGFVSEQLDSVLLQQIYPLLNSVSFSPTPWADEVAEKVLGSSGVCVQLEQKWSSFAGKNKSHREV